ncbi:MAG: dipicolinate synthase subunit B [Clostridia bacterium]|nr:dipicolinate synthase subunit B [Clostridia bacterium]
MTNKNIGIAITGSFCTFKKLLPVIKELKEHNNIVPIFSYAVTNTDTRFYKAQQFYDDIKELAGNAPITTIVDAEPIGPQSKLDLIIVAPCTGNTLAKLTGAITDTPVLMAVKAHLRNDKPVLIAISTNDGLLSNAGNIGQLIGRKNFFFVPFSQDNYIDKKFSLVADFGKVAKAAELALEGVQMQPVLTTVE